MFCSGAIEVSPSRVAIATTCMISFIPAMIYSVISQSGNSRGDVSSATASFCYRVQLHSYFTNPLSASGLRYLHHRLEIVSESRELKVPLHISIRTAVARDRSLPGRCDEQRDVVPLPRSYNVSPNPISLFSLSI